MKNILTFLLYLSIVPICSSQDCLLADYHFDGNADDQTGNNFHDYPDAPQLIEDRFGNPESAYLFDGVNDYIKLNEDQAIITSSDFTITVWVRMNGL
ncbi:MAG: hypothetical protein AAF985_03990 [Bacteroidota bacterium]